MRKLFCMSFSAAVLLIAQSIAPAATEAPAARADSAPVTAMASVRASATIIRPAKITFTGNDAFFKAHGQSASLIQSERDAQGTVWIEFS